MTIPNLFRFSIAFLATCVLLPSLLIAQDVTPELLPDVYVSPDPNDPTLGTVEDREVNILYATTIVGDEYPLVWAMENSREFGNHIRLKPVRHSGFQGDPDAPAWRIGRVNGIFIQYARRPNDH